MQLRAYRKAKGLTLADIAELMGFIDKNTGLPRPATVHRHEQGLRTPDLPTIERYRKVTGGDVTYDDWAKLPRKLRREAGRNKSQTRKESANV
jgi:transcriptional regulator with XRE-family HTH domain